MIMTAIFNEDYKIEYLCVCLCIYYIIYFMVLIGLLAWIAVTTIILILMIFKRWLMQVLVKCRCGCLAPTPAATPQAAQTTPVTTPQATVSTRHYTPDSPDNTSHTIPDSTDCYPWLHKTFDKFWRWRFGEHPHQIQNSCS